MDNSLEAKRLEAINAIAMFTYMRERLDEGHSVTLGELAPFLNGRSPIGVIVALTDVLTGVLADAGEGNEPLKRVALALNI